MNTAPVLLLLLEMDEVNALCCVRIGDVDDVTFRRDESPGKMASSFIWIRTLAPFLLA